MTTERMTDEEFEAKMICATSFKERSIGALGEARRARRVEQEQTEKIRKLEEHVALLAQERAEWQDATACTSPRQAEECVKTLHEKADAANECARLTNDKMAEQVRQARWEVADTAINKSRGADAYLWNVRDANAPKD